MDFLGFVYTKGKTGAIDNYRFDIEADPILSAGLCVQLADEETIEVFDGVKPFFGVSFWNKKSVCMMEEVPMKGVIYQDSYNVTVAYTGAEGAVTVGSPVYLQADGTVSDADGGFGYFIAMSAETMMKDWDDSEKLGIKVCTNIYDQSIGGTTPPVSAVVNKASVKVAKIGDKK